MATFLYRLGRFSFRRRRLVLMLWIAMLAAVGIGAAGVSASSSESSGIPGTQSQRAIDLLAKEFPQASADGATARVVFEAPTGRTLTSASQKAEVESLVTALKSGTQVASITDPYAGGTVSKDGTIAYAQVTYKVPQSEVSNASHDALKDISAQGEKAGLAVSMGGSAVAEEAGQSATELIGIGIAAVVLVITFGSLVAAGLPLLTALFGVGTAIGAISVASSVMNLSSSTSTLALMLGLAVAIDYALFIVSRYRGELAEGRTPEEAAGRALGTAGSAVVFAGLTVVIALAGLSVIGIGMLTEIGLGAAFAVIVAVVIALTLLPAMLGFAGTRITGSKARARRGRSSRDRGRASPPGCAGPSSCCATRSRSSRSPCPGCFCSRSRPCHSNSACPVTRRLLPPAPSALRTTRSPTVSAPATTDRSAWSSTPAAATIPRPRRPTRSPCSTSCPTLPR